MSKNELDDQLDDLDVALAVRKYINNFEIYSEAMFFAIGFLVRAGYDFNMARSMAKEILIKEWK